MITVTMRVAAVALLLAAQPAAQEVPDPTPRVQHIARLLASDDREVQRAGLDGLDALRVGHLWGHVLPSAWAELDGHLLTLAQGEDAELACSANLLLLASPPDAVAARQHASAMIETWRRDGGDRLHLAALQAALAEPEGQQWIAALAEFAGPGPAQAGALAVLAMLGPAAKATEPQLRAALTATPAAGRWRVAVALAAIGCHEPLIAALTAENARQRRCATFALLADQHVAMPAENVLTCLGDEYAVVRRRALTAAPRLAELPHAVILTIARLLEDPMLPDDAARALQALGPRAAPAVPHLLGLLATREPEREYVGTNAIVCLGAIGPPARDAVAAIVTWALAGHEHGYDNHSPGEALAKIAPADGVNLLARAFAEDLRGERDDLWPSAAALRGLGAAAAPEFALFVGALDHAGLPQRQNALYVLVGLGPAAQLALPQVLAQLDGDDHWTWSLVNDYVRGIGPAAAPLAIPKFEQRFAAVAPHLRSQLVHCLHVLGAAAEPLLLRASADADPLVRQQADEALLQLMDLSEVGAARLIELLAKREPKDSRNRLTDMPPWRRLERPLSQLSAIPPALARRLPELLDHPDQMAFAAIRTACVRALCPKAADNAAWTPVLTPLDREELRRVLTSRPALRLHLEQLTHGDETALAAAARELLPFLE